MLGMLNLLPLLKGWEYKKHELPSVTLIRGAEPTELLLRERGWLLTIMFATNDCYATLKVAYQGATLEMHETEWNAELARSIGAVTQDPGGWVQRYFRPNPNSTAGIFYVVAFSGGFQGSTWPYVPTIKVSAYLPEDSTQESAVLSGIAGTIAITDLKAFIRSLRAVLGVKDMKIDPALLVVGPAEVKKG